MSKTKKVILSLSVIAVVLLSLFFIVSEMNLLPDLDFDEIISVNGTPTNNTVMTNEQIIDALKAERSSATKYELFDNMNALWLDINKDITADAAEGTDAVKYSIYSDIDFYRKRSYNVFRQGE